MDETTEAAPIYGPAVRWFNPLQVRVRLRHDGWAAIYRYRNGSVGVTGCRSRREAIDSVRHSATIRVTMVDGKFVEVP